MEGMPAGMAEDTQKVLLSLHDQDLIPHHDESSVCQWLCHPMGVAQKLHNVPQPLQGDASITEELRCP
jgi:hypothetical protein